MKYFIGGIIATILAGVIFVVGFLCGIITYGWAKDTPKKDERKE